MDSQVLYFSSACSLFATPGHSAPDSTEIDEINWFMDDVQPHSISNTLINTVINTVLSFKYSALTLQAKLLVFYFLAIYSATTPFQCFHPYHSSTQGGLIDRFL